MAAASIADAKRLDLPDRIMAILLEFATGLLVNQRSWPAAATIKKRLAAKRAMQPSSRRPSPLVYGGPGHGYGYYPPPTCPPPAIYGPGIGSTFRV